LTKAEDYTYLNQSGCIKVPKIDDADDFEKVRSAMKLLDFGKDEQAIFQILAAILHLGNFKFSKKTEGFSGEGVEIANPERIEPFP